MLARAPRPEEPSPMELELARKIVEEEQKFLRAVVLVQCAGAERFRRVCAPGSSGEMVGAVGGGLGWQHTHPHARIRKEVAQACC